MKITHFEKQTATIKTSKYAIIEDDNLNHKPHKVDAYGDGNTTFEVELGIIKNKDETYSLYDGDGGNAFPWGTINLNDRYRKGLKDWEEMKFDSLQKAVNFLIQEQLPVGKELIVDLD